MYCEIRVHLAQSLNTSTRSLLYTDSQLSHPNQQQIVIDSTLKITKNITNSKL